MLRGSCASQERDDMYFRWRSDAGLPVRCCTHVTPFVHAVQLSDGAVRSAQISVAWLVVIFVARVGIRWTLADAHEAVMPPIKKGALRTKILKVPRKYRVRDEQGAERTNHEQYTRVKNAKTS